jgi:hypothetical protein
LLPEEKVANTALADVDGTKHDVVFLFVCAWAMLMHRFAYKN